VYSTIPDWVEKILPTFGPQDLMEAKLQVLQQMDAPLDAQNEGMDHFFLGLDWELKRQYRQRLFDTELSAVAHVAKKYLAADATFSSCTVGQG
ncbi:hypothetical protein HDU91_001898, partial [Kappamyces sp. JEL0680]